MNRSDPFSVPHRSAGFTLPAVLVVVAALLILVIGLLAMSGIERRTARSFVDYQRADMAARAGLEEVKGLLDREGANDDFLIVSGTPDLPSDADKNLEAASYLFLARPETQSGKVRYSYLPLFSTDNQPERSGDNQIVPPDASELYGKDPVKFDTQPWLNPAMSAWIPIKAKNNGKEQTVARYAYWVEDLQGKLNPKIAGNDKGTGNAHYRSQWPFPAPGLNTQPLSEKEPALDGIALYALDKKATDDAKNDLTKRVLDGRNYMISPDSILAAAGFSSPLQRGTDGLLTDEVASALERNLSPVIQPYEEMPTIPYSPALRAEVYGKPKMNLNKLLKGDRDSAINDFAAQVRKAMPNFDQRKGGFNASGSENLNPNLDDYVSTLAANALDYADSDEAPSIKEGRYRGIEGFPFMSEIVLKMEYQGHMLRDNRRVMMWQFRLYVEYWNMTDKKVKGSARVSYEVGLNPEGIGGAARGRAFDDRSLLLDPVQSQHQLQEIEGRFFTPEFVVELLPDEYKFYKVATVSYLIDIGPNNISFNTPFSLVENLSEARGMTSMWNNQKVERIDGIVRDRFSLDFNMMSYPRKKAKAAIPSGSFGPYGTFTNNMGDPRMSHYFRNRLVPLGENAFPENISPNRRNIRRFSIYDKVGGDRNFFGRVMPSEWPDRGHDSAYGVFAAFKQDDMTVEPEDTKWQNKLTKYPENAPHRISNAGRFYSATELGRVYDPIMWTQVYDDLKNKPGTGTSDTKQLTSSYPVMPMTRNVFPDVGLLSASSDILGGGNTLRVGRYEHARFDREVEGLRAGNLLDLFHTGKSTSEKDDEREGDLIEINGQINLNTASKDVLRTMAAGILRQDPELRTVTNWTHELTNGRMAPKSTKIELGTPSRDQAADLVAEAILLRRPFSSMGALSALRDKNDNPVFGNPDLYTKQTNINWTDAAAEELFARIHDAGTFRSRNFRVWVIGQSVTGNENSPEVVAETRKVFTVFADPGERNAQGAIVPKKNKARVTYENSF